MPDPVQIGLLLCLDSLKLPVQRVALAYEDVPPPLGALYSRLAEHVEQLAPGIGGQLLEVGTHGVEHGLAGGYQAGKDAGLLPRPPLRTVRAGFPAYGSSTPRRHRLFATGILKEFA